MSWLTTVQDWAANAAQGNGLIIAVVLAFVSFAIGIAVACNWHARAFLIAAIVLNLAYWVLGQGFGGIFNGGATDPNAGPLFVLLACALYALVPVDDRYQRRGVALNRHRSAFGPRPCRPLDRVPSPACRRRLAPPPRRKTKW